MSVLQIKSRTTLCQQEFQKYSLSSNSIIYTDAANENIEEYSIELSLGQGWNDNYSPSDKNLRKIDSGITLRGHESIVVEVEEQIWVPHNRYGVVLPTGSLFLSRGILIASAKVEPAFKGKLKLRMFNTTNQKITINKGSKLGSVIFFATESTKTHNFTYRASEISSPPTRTIKKLKKWLYNNKSIWIGWALNILTSSLTVVIATHFLN